MQAYSGGAGINSNGCITAQPCIRTAGRVFGTGWELGSTQQEIQGFLHYQVRNIRGNSSLEFFEGPGNNYRRYLAIIAYPAPEQKDYLKYIGDMDATLKRFFFVRVQAWYEMLEVYRLTYCACYYYSVSGDHTTITQEAGPVKDAPPLQLSAPARSGSHRSFQPGLSAFRNG